MESGPRGGPGSGRVAARGLARRSTISAGNQRIGRGGLEAVSILVGASHRFFQPSQVLVDPNARILSEAVEIMWASSPPGDCTERDPHEGTPVGSGLEAHGARGFNPRSFGAPRDDYWPCLITTASHSSLAPIGP
jgi:hypothetical protein